MVDNQSDGCDEEDESLPVELESFDKHGTGSGSGNESIQIDGKYCETEDEQIKMNERVQDPNLKKRDKINIFKCKQKPLTFYFKDRRVMELDTGRGDGYPEQRNFKREAKDA